MTRRQRIHAAWYEMDLRFVYGLAADEGTGT